MDLVIDYIPKTHNTSARLEIYDPSLVVGPNKRGVTVHVFDRKPSSAQILAAVTVSKGAINAYHKLLRLQDVHVSAGEGRADE